MFIITDIIEENTIKSVVKKDVSRVSIVGNGTIRNIDFIKDIINIIDENKLEMLEFNVSDSKISIDFKNVISDDILKKIHEILNNNFTR